MRPETDVVTLLPTPPTPPKSSLKWPCQYGPATKPTQPLSAKIHTPAHLARQLARRDRTSRNIGARYSSCMVSGHQRITSVIPLMSPSPHALATNRVTAKNPGQLHRASRSGTAEPV